MSEVWMHRETGQLAVWQQDLPNMYYPPLLFRGEKDIIQYFDPDDWERLGEL